MAPGRSRAVALRTAKPLVRVKLPAQGVVYVDAVRLAGWIGRVVPRAVVPPTDGPMGEVCVECTGEGVVLVDPSDELPPPPLAKDTAPRPRTPSFKQPPPPPQPAMAPRPPSDPLERQLTRLANFITKAEYLLVSMQSTLRNVGTGGGGYAPRRARGPADKDEQNSVLAEIFKSNVALLRNLEVAGVGETVAPANTDGGAEPAGAPEPVASAPSDRPAGA
jgi:hypothetical protein